MVPFCSRKTHPRSDVASLVLGFRSKRLLIPANRAREPERECPLPLNEPRALFGRHISAIEKASYKLVGEGVVTMCARTARAALGTPAAALKTTPAPPFNKFLARTLIALWPRQQIPSIDSILETTLIFHC